MKRQNIFKSISDDSTRLAMLKRAESDVAYSLRGPLGEEVRRTPGTFASLLLQQGESPVYVQRQLGHASITLTVGPDGRWLPMGNKAAVDRGTS